MSTLQSSSSDVRELLPGWPEVFRIKKHSSMIFIFNNAFDDRVFKFKINRKMGFPNYQICSSRTLVKKDCLASLKPRTDDNVALFKDNIFKVEENLVLGRSHELTFNQFSEHYCTNCTYYLALYSGYDLIQAPLSVMPPEEPTVLDSSSSITTIVYRDQPDDYLIASASLVAVLYQIEGRLQVEYRTGLEEFQPYRSANSSESIVTISMPTSTSASSEFYIRLRPMSNSPSALYTLVVIDA